MLFTSGLGSYQREPYTIFNITLAPLPLFYQKKTKTKQNKTNKQTNKNQTKNKAKQNKNKQTNKNQNKTKQKTKQKKTKPKKNISKLNGIWYPEYFSMYFS